MSRKLCMLLILFFALSSLSADSADYRVWTSKKGEKIDAIYRRCENEMAILRLKSGREIKVLLENLSETDKTYISGLTFSADIEKVLLLTLHVKNPVTPESLSKVPLKISVDSVGNVLLDFQSKQWVLPFDYQEFWDASDIYESKRRKTISYDQFLLFQTVVWKGSMLVLAEQSKVNDASSLIQALASRKQIDMTAEQILQIKSLKSKASETIVRLKEKAKNAEIASKNSNKKELPEIDESLKGSFRFDGKVLQVLNDGIILVGKMRSHLEHKDALEKHALFAEMDKKKKLARDQNEFMEIHRKQSELIGTIALPTECTCFVAGITDRLADDETWKGDVFPAGLYKYVNTMGAQKTIRAYATSKELAAKIYK